MSKATITKEIETIVCDICHKDMEYDVTRTEDERWSVSITRGSGRQRLDFHQACLWEQFTVHYTTPGLPQKGDVNARPKKLRK